MKLATVEIGTVVADIEQQILDVDNAYEEILGWTRNEIIGRKALSFTYQADLGGNQPALDALAMGGPAFQITKRYVQATGAIIWVENHVSKIRGSQGHMLLSATTKVIERPFDADALSANYEWISRACAFLVAGRRRLGNEIVWAPAIEALLRLYRAELEGRSVTIEQLSDEIACASSVMARWVKVLVERNLVELDEVLPSLDQTYVRLTAACERTLDGLLAGR